MPQTESNVNNHSFYYDPLRIYVGKTYLEPRKVILKSQTLSSVLLNVFKKAKSAGTPDFLIFFISYQHTLSSRCLTLS